MNTKKLKKTAIKFIPVARWRRSLRKKIRVQEAYENSQMWLKKFAGDGNCTFEEDRVEVYGVKFSTSHYNLGSIFESFGRREYEIGGIKDYIFVDVGANMGDSALFAAAKRDCKKVYAYEPFEEVYKLAKVNIGLNPQLAEKIRLFRKGWSDESKLMEAFILEDLGRSEQNTLVDFAHIVGPHKATGVTVEKSSRELKKIMEENPGSPIVLKLDIEGSEYACINELYESGMLKEVDAIIMEWHYNGYESLTKLLDQCGYIWFNHQGGQRIGMLKAVNVKRARAEG